MRVHLLAILLIACEAEPSGQDAQPDSGMRRDATTLDAEPMDSEPIDADALDAEAIDAEPMDAEPLDAEPMDSEPMDAEPTDAEPTDAGGSACMVTFTGFATGTYPCNPPNAFYSPGFDSSSIALGLAVAFPPNFEIHLAFDGAPMPRFYPLADLTDERAFYQDGVHEPYVCDPAGHAPPIGPGYPAGTATLAFSAAVPTMVSGGLQYYELHGLFDCTLVSSTSSTSTNAISAHVQF